MNTLRMVRFIIWGVALLILVGTGAVLYEQREGVASAVAIGGPFRLTDQHGAMVTEAALKGHPSALFFGYTYCPDVCPTTLSDMSGWLQKLGPDGDRLKVYFVTVDPERDTREQLSEYLQAFDARITGLTGARAAIDQMLKEYRVYSRKVPIDGGGYSMDHTASVYLLDKDAGFAGTVDYQEDPDKALAKLKQLVARS